MLSFLSFRDANILTPPLLSLEYLTFYLYKLILRRKKGRLLSQTPFLGYRLWVLEYQLCEIVEAVLPDNEVVLSLWVVDERAGLPCTH